MLAADKLQLQSALKQQATALKEKEFNLHYSNMCECLAEPKKKTNRWKSIFPPQNILKQHLMLLVFHFSTHILTINSDGRNRCSDLSRTRYYNVYRI